MGYLYTETESRNRERKAGRLRQQGWTFKAIGESFGVSASRATQLVDRHNRRQAYMHIRPWLPEPPTAPPISDEDNSLSALARALKEALLRD